MNLFPVEVAGVSLWLAIMVPGALHVRRRPESSHRRLA